MRTARISAASRFADTVASAASSARGPMMFFEERSPKKPFPIMEFNARAAAKFTYSAQQFQ
jgi:hypothetical protein